MTIPAGFAASLLNAACAAHFLSATGGVCIHVSTSGWGKCTDSRHLLLSQVPFIDILFDRFDQKLFTRQV